MTHAKCTGAETPTGHSSQHQDAGQSNRQNSRNKSKQLRTGSKPITPKETPNNDDVQRMNNNYNVNDPSINRRSESDDEIQPVPASPKLLPVHDATSTLVESEVSDDIDDNMSIVSLGPQHL